MQIKTIINESVCKICGSGARLYGVTDFNTACYANNVHRYVYPLSGIPVYYHQCNTCGLIFTHAFDDWTDEEFQQHIYNDDYLKYDPAFNQTRPEKNAEILLSNFKELFSCTMLDFGCGDGQLANKLKEKNVNVTGWDPFHNDAPMPEHTFEFVTSFEVMEHTPDPLKTVFLINELMDKKTGKYFFSTGVCDNHVDEIMNNWYIAPRNGHVTIYSKKSLEILFARFGMKVVHFSEWYHLAYRSE